jgi:uncharacterized membrane protein
MSKNAKLYIAGIVLLILFSVSSTVYNIKNGPEKEKAVAKNTTPEVSEEKKVEETSKPVETEKVMKTEVKARVDGAYVKHEKYINNFKKKYISAYNDNDIDRIASFVDFSVPLYGEIKKEISKNNKKQNKRLEYLVLDNYRVEDGYIFLDTLERIGIKKADEENYIYTNYKFTYKVSYEMDMYVVEMKERK